jgi:hypothetical protein
LALEEINNSIQGMVLRVNLTAQRTSMQKEKTKQKMQTKYITRQLI